MVEGLALELGETVSGHSEIIPGNTFIFFWDTRFVADKDVLNAAAGLNLVAREVSEVEDENWTQKCQDLIVPITAGTLKIQPYMEAPLSPVVDPHEIAIIPGLGFGTGHHDTTRTLVEELVRDKEGGQAFATALDVGTGSGILAIAAAKLFGSAVEAIDNDPDAINNALENVTINGCNQLVNLSTRTLSSFSGPFDLILANIYAEVLVSFVGEFERLAKKGTFLFVSGITLEKRDLVAKAFTHSGVWSLRRWVDSNSWCSGSFERTQI